MSELESIAIDLKEIKDMLCGDAINGRLGMLHHHNQMYEDLYGEDFHGHKSDESVKNCVLTRISKVEDTQKKQKWIFRGITFTLAALWAFYQWLFYRESK